VCCLLAAGGRRNVVVGGRPRAPVRTEPIVYFCATFAVRATLPENMKVYDIALSGHIFQRRAVLHSNIDFNCQARVGTGA